MGISQCHDCHSQVEKLSEMRLMQINRKSLSENGDKVEVLILDTERDKVISNIVEMRVVKNLKGLSEINYKNSLFLIGNSEENSENGSYNFKFTNISAEETKIELLINSQYTHVSPSLCYIGDETILVVGGKSQLACESYDVGFSKWAERAKLPEERFHCTLALDNGGKYVYLFGGFCKEKNRICGNVFRLGVRGEKQWEKIDLLDKGSYEILTISSSASLSLPSGILLLGGKNSQGTETDQIISFSPNELRARPLGLRLKNKARFYLQSGALRGTFAAFFNVRNEVEKVFLRDIKIKEDGNNKDNIEN